MLHAPDFLGYAGAVELARDAPQAVERGLALKKTGNEVMALVGGREIHPINVRVGGFYRAPTRRELRDARRAARARARGGARDRPLDGRVRLPGARASSASSSRSRTRTTTRSSAGGFAPTPGSTSPPASTTSTSRRSTSSARPRSTRGCASAARTCAGRSRASRSTTTGSRRSRGTAAARPDSRRRAAIRSAASSSAASSSSTRATRRCASSRRYEEPDVPAVPVEPVAGTGFGVSEAPRGLLYHRYRGRSPTGSILDAKIVPPTSQNQRAIEDDLRDVVGRYAHLDDERAARRSASRRSATTTRASRAPRTSSPSRWSGDERTSSSASGTSIGGDDGVGLAVAERLRGRVPAGVDVVPAASRSRAGSSTRGREPRARSSSTPSSPGAAPGTLHRFDASGRPDPGSACSARRRTRSASARRSSSRARSARLPRPRRGLRGRGRPSSPRARG